MEEKVVRIPADEITLYSIDYIVPMEGSTKGSSRRRLEGKEKLIEAMARDNVVAIGRPKSTYSNTTRQRIQTFWCQAAPMKYFTREESKSRGNMFALILGDGTRVVVACQCHFEVSKSQRLEVTPCGVEPLPEMTVARALKVGWTLSEHPIGSDLDEAVYWICPNCSGTKPADECEHSFDVWFEGDKIFPGAYGSVRKLITHAFIDGNLMVTRSFRICGKCRFFEEMDV